MNLAIHFVRKHLQSKNTKCINFANKMISFLQKEKK